MSTEAAIKALDEVLEITAASEIAVASGKTSVAHISPYEAQRKLDKFLQETGVKELSVDAAGKVKLQPSSKRKARPSRHS